MNKSKWTRTCFKYVSRQTLNMHFCLLVIFFLCSFNLYSQMPEEYISHEDAENLIASSSFWDTPRTLTVSPDSKTSLKISTDKTTILMFDDIVNPDGTVQNMMVGYISGEYGLGPTDFFLDIRNSKKLIRRNSKQKTVGEILFDKLILLMNEDKPVNKVGMVQAMENDRLLRKVIEDEKSKLPKDANISEAELFERAFKRTPTYKTFSAVGYSEVEYYNKNGVQFIVSKPVTKVEVPKTFSNKDPYAEMTDEELHATIQKYMDFFNKTEGHLPGLNDGAPNANIADVKELIANESAVHQVLGNTMGGATSAIQLRARLKKDIKIDANKLAMAFLLNELYKRQYSDATIFYKSNISPYINDVMDSEDYKKISTSKNTVIENSSKLTSIDKEDASTKEKVIQPTITSDKPDVQNLIKMALQPETNIEEARDYLSKAYQMLNEDFSLKLKYNMAKEKIAARPKQALIERLKAKFNDVSYIKEDYFIIHALDYITENLNGKIENKEMAKITFGTIANNFEDGVLHQAVEMRNTESSTKKSINGYLNTLRPLILCNNDFIVLDSGETIKIVDLLLQDNVRMSARVFMGLDNLTATKASFYLPELHLTDDLINKGLEKLELISNELLKK
jgi:hypothetical protein